MDLSNGRRPTRPAAALKDVAMSLNQPTLDRRAFMSGRLTEPDALVKPPGAEIASMLVQARLDRLDEVAAAITAIAGCEVHARDPKGKLVVVIETTNASAIGSALNTIALLPNVYSASLVFHAIDA
jgi:nitrate reductase NapD